MSVVIYNSLTRQKETFKPIEAGKVRMYVCGPTVYDYIHIGNARPAIFFDVVRRYLEYAGYEVNYISNFTDVDDRLIKKSNELGVTVQEVADRFIAAYYEDVEALGIRRASANPRVMDHIEDVVAFIAELVNKGHAYESGGDVYFKTASFADYGKLSHQNLEELQHGIRVEVDERKADAQDFVLWKAAKPGEVNWDSPWGKGRPGWHIECSAMARKYLGNTLDIHGGGLDLQFPHHECEVAQSESLTKEPLANYWMHNGYIHINNEKMSKSLGNGITVHELVKHVKPQAIRYFMLATHYRSPLNFSDDTIAQATNSVERIGNCYTNILHRLKGTEQAAEHDEVVDGLKIELNKIEQVFSDKMNDDFNTPDAITALFELVSLANTQMQATELNVASLQALKESFERLDEVLGLLPMQTEEPSLDAQVEALIVERTEARANKNWTRADEIRDTLQAMNIVLEDTPQGIRWRRK